MQPSTTQEQLLKTADLQVSKLLKKSKLRILTLPEVQQLSLLARVIADSVKQEELEAKKISVLSDEELRVVLETEWKRLRKPKKTKTPHQDTPKLSKTQESTRKAPKDISGNGSNNPGKLKTTGQDTSEPSK